MSSTVMIKVPEQAMMRVRMEYPGLSASGLVQLLVAKYAQHQVDIDEESVMEFYRLRNEAWRRAKSKAQTTVVENSGGNL